MSDTPETDNAAFAACEVHEDCGVVYAEFAEQLERERDEARELAANLEISLTAVIRSANVRQDETEHAMAKRDKAEKQASESINQVGKMLLRIEKIKLEHKYECQKLREGYLKVIADLHETIFNLRSELNSTERARQIWKNSHAEVADNRDMWMDEAHTLLEANHLLEKNK